MKKIFFKLHLWLSIPFGIIVSVLCITGALLIFETEIQQITTPSRFYPKEVKDAPIALNELIPLVQKQLPDSVSISSVTFPAEKNLNYRMGMTGMGRTSLVVDPYSGEIMDRVTPYAKGNFFSGVRRLHRWFMYPMQRDKTNWGKMLTGTTTLLFVFILISGLIIWIPKTVKMLKRRLKIKLSAGKFRFWYDFHVAGGMYALIFLLVMSLTGLTWSFEWYRTGFYKVFGVEMVQQGGGHGVSQTSQEKSTQGHTSRRSSSENSENPERPSREERSEKNEGEDGSERKSRGNRDDSGGENGEKRSGGRPGGEYGKQGREMGPDYIIWTKVYEELAAANPNYKSISVQDGSASVSIPATVNSRASDRYTFNPRTGEITDSQLYKDSAKASKMRGWIYTFHVGNWGGLFTRILYFIACIIGGFLPLTGYYIYYKKRFGKKRKKKVERV